MPGLVTEMHEGLGTALTIQQFYQPVDQLSDTEQVPPSPPGHQGQPQGHSTWPMVV